MNFRSSLKVLAGIVLSFLVINVAIAESTPKFSIIPVTTSTITVPSNGGSSINYRVTNNTSITRTLTIIPQPGVTQIAGAGLCSIPFTLAHGQSCILSLAVSGLTVNTTLVKGPVVCKTKTPTDNSPSLFLCSQPAKQDELKVRIGSASSVTISQTGSPILLSVNSPVPGILRVTNHSTTTISYNVRATLPASLSSVTQDASACTILLPGSTCELRFFAGSTTTQLIGFTVAGSNTNVLHPGLQVYGAGISFVGRRFLVLQVNNLTTRALTIRNNSQTVTATNISATLPVTWTNIVQDASQCLSVAPGASCNLLFTVQLGAVAHLPTLVPISGTNTDEIFALMGVEPTGTATIQVTGTPDTGSSLSLRPGGNIGNLTVTNLSSTTTATLIAPDLSLLGNEVGQVTPVPNPCDAVNPEQSCQLLLSSKWILGTFVFDIAGTNTTTAQGTVIVFLNINDYYLGGRVACLNGGSDLNGNPLNIVAAIADAPADPPAFNPSTYYWGDPTVTTNAISAIDGQLNQTTILSTNACGGVYSFCAALACSNYEVDRNGNTPCQPGITCFDQWYLPAEDQLQCMMDNIGTNTNFIFDIYWSSTETSTPNAAACAKNGTCTNTAGKAGTQGVRCASTIQP